VRIFLAGASGAIGRRLIPLLLSDGHSVMGTTRSAAKAAELETQGVTPIVLDVFDADGVRKAVSDAQPEVVIHQLTDLPQVLDPARMAASRERNTRLRVEGTANLVVAARAAGARRLMAQSIAFAYADGPEPHGEADPLASAEGDDPSAVTARGVRALEDAVLGASGIDGIVLRYGRLYGPGTWFAEATAKGPLHVDAAAQAARLAVTQGTAGIYNIAEDDGALLTEKARRELGFDPGFRLTA
jgi:nucleoside-diphosphate-sugar epimerase